MQDNVEDQVNWVNVSMQNRVRKGVELLDRTDPGWQGRIDLTILDMGSERCCILGQLYGHYHDGIRRLSINGEEYGFDGVMCRSDTERARAVAYEKLTKLWRQECNA